MAIKDKFDGAAEVKVVKNEGIEKPRIVMKNSQFKRHTNADLVRVFGREKVEIQKLRSFKIGQNWLRSVEIA